MYTCVFLLLIKLFKPFWATLFFIEVCAGNPINTSFNVIWTDKKVQCGPNWQLGESLKMLLKLLTEEIALGMLRLW